MSLDDTTTRRSVLKLSGTALAAAVGAGAASADHTHPDVETEPATDVGKQTATLNGDLLSMGNADSVDVWFEWGELFDGLPNATSKQSVTSTGPFSTTLDLFDGLSTDTNYEFRAMSNNGSTTESGSVLQFQTEDGPCCPSG